jgi:hypothetical protein
MAASIITGAGDEAIARGLYEAAVRQEMAELERLTAQRLISRAGEPCPWAGVYPCLANVIDRLAARGYDRARVAEAFWTVSQ